MHPTSTTTTTTRSYHRKIRSVTSTVSDSLDRSQQNPSTSSQESSDTPGRRPHRIHPPSSTSPSISSSSTPEYAKKTPKPKSTWVTSIPNHSHTTSSQSSSSTTPSSSSVPSSQIPPPLPSLTRSISAASTAITSPSSKSTITSTTTTTTTTPSTTNLLKKSDSFDFLDNDADDEDRALYADEISLFQKRPPEQPQPSQPPTPTKRKKGGGKQQSQQAKTKRKKRAAGGGWFAEQQKEEPVGVAPAAEPSLDWEIPSIEQQHFSDLSSSSEDDYEPLRELARGDLVLALWEDDFNKEYHPAKVVELRPTKASTSDREEYRLLNFADAVKWIPRKQILTLEKNTHEFRNCKVVDYHYIFQSKVDFKTKMNLDTHLEFLFPTLQEMVRLAAQRDQPPPPPPPSLPLTTTLDLISPTCPSAGQLSLSDNAAALNHETTATTTNDPTQPLDSSTSTFTTSTSSPSSSAPNTQLIPHLLNSQALKDYIHRRDASLRLRIQSHGHRADLNMVEEEHVLGWLRDGCFPDLTFEEHSDDEFPGRVRRREGVTGAGGGGGGGNGNVNGGTAGGSINVVLRVPSLVYLDDDDDDGTNNSSNSSGGVKEGGKDDNDAIRIGDAEGVDTTTISTTTVANPLQSVPPPRKKKTLRECLHDANLLLDSVLLPEVCLWISVERQKEKVVEQEQQQASQSQLSASSSQQSSLAGLTKSKRRRKEGGGAGGGDGIGGGGERVVSVPAKVYQEDVNTRRVWVHKLMHMRAPVVEWD